MPRPKFLLFLADGALVLLSLHLAVMLRIRPGLAAIYETLHTPLPAVFCLAVVLFATYTCELYEVRNFSTKRFILVRAASVGVGSLAVLSALFYAVPSLEFGRGVLLLFLILNGIAQAGLRFLVRRLARNIHFANRIFVIGTGELAQEIYQIIPKDGNLHSFVRFITGNNQESWVDPSLVVGEIEDIDPLMQDYRPNSIIVALQDRRGVLPLRELMHYKLRNVEIIEAANYFEQQRGCLWVERMQPSSFVYAQGFRMTPFMRGYKRFFDILFSSFGLLLAAPLIPLLAALIKLDSPGPVFYKQLRVGENEVEYFIYKFRTMREDAEEETGAVWALQNDSRVTRLGACMRKTRLDEIPQLYNVLKGEMSFIGPRPERMAFVERLKNIIPFYSTRHFIKPGITGWAQIRYPYGATDEDALEKLRYDLFYIKNYSLNLDLRIIVDTIRVVLTGFGGR